jgi:hypothetical protein
MERAHRVDVIDKTIARQHQWCVKARSANRRVIAHCIDQTGSVPPLVVA